MTADRSRRRTRSGLLGVSYLYSDAVTAQPLRRRPAFGDQRHVEDLASPAGLLLKSLLANNPTGEMLHVLDQLERTPAPVTDNSIPWVSPGPLACTP